MALRVGLDVYQDNCGYTAMEWFSNQSFLRICDKEV